MNSQADEVELLSEESAARTDDVARQGWLGNRAVVAIAVVIMVAIAAWSLARPGDRQDDEAESPGLPPPTGAEDLAEPGVSDRLDASLAARDIPESLLAAELFHAAPGPDTLRRLFQAVGGFDGLTIASTEGTFDLIRFDPTNPDRLLASVRSSYGAASNEDTNEVWHITPDAVDRTLWSPQQPHDYVEFNVDGSLTMWVHGGDGNFAPRSAVVLSNGEEPIFSTAPLYASRFTATKAGVFALTGTGDYYSTDPGYVDLVVDKGDGPVVLDDGALYSWVDNPTVDILVAYPVDEAGSTSVWDVESLEPLPSHPLANRPYVRAAISGDGQRALGVTFDGAIEVVDMTTAQVTDSFGSVDVIGVDQPIIMDASGTIAWTVEHHGRVSTWWIGDSKPIGTVATYSGQPRWVSERYSPTTTSVVAPGGTRALLRTEATAANPGQWLLVDTDIDSWIQRACELAGRGLRANEATRIGLSGRALIC